MPNKTCQVFVSFTYIYYFTYKNDYYKQISGCAMGSPISAAIANLVFEHVEEVALTTAPNSPRWWFGFVDYSHASLKREYVKEFHKHLNSIKVPIRYSGNLHISIV